MFDSSNKCNTYLSTMYTLKMGIRKTRRTYIIIAVGLIFLVVTHYTIYDKTYGHFPRQLSSEDEQQVIRRTKPYSSPGSIAAVINTAKMGTGGLTSSFHRSWECEGNPKVNDVIPGLCEDNRIMIRTHFFENGSDYIQQHRRVHPEGQCLIATAIRNPADWFGSMFLQWTKKDWKPTEEMLRDYKEFLAEDDFRMLQKALPGLLKEFNIGSLIDQTKIMEENGGYSLIPAPISSALAGCDLLFLRMEQSDQWPDIFQMLDPELKNTIGESRVDQHPENLDQINTIASYKLSSEEKINIYNSRGKFVQDWFDAYGYMDDVVMDESSIVMRTKSYSTPGSIAAVINTAKMGTGGLERTFHESWKCKGIPSEVKSLSVGLCGNNRIAFRTHFFENGSDYIQQHRRVHPEGQCLIATAIRNPADWFGPMYLERVKNDWKPTEEILRDYKEFLAGNDFRMLQKALPGLLKEFNIGSLIDQTKIMEENGGYSLIPAPISSALAGCDLLFLRMEQSDQWPDIFKTLDPELKNTIGESRVDQHPENLDQINSIKSYKLSSEEKINIYNNSDKFVQDWFDAYGYMDDVNMQIDTVDNIAIA